MYIFLLFYRCLVFVPSMLCHRVVGAEVVICLEQGADLHMAQLHAGCHSLSLGSVKNRAIKLLLMVLLFFSQCYTANAIIQ